VPTECASRLQHPLNAGVHFFLFDELAARDLVDSHLHLFLKPLVMREQPLDGLPDEFVGASTGLERKLIEFGFLILRQRYFHDHFKDNPDWQVAWRRQSCPLAQYRIEFLII
jgi:hypothetical protein